MDIWIPLIILGVLGVLFGALLGIASKKFHVAEDPLIPAVRECLPGANCGGCGYPGCDAYAAAVVKGEAPINKCNVGGASTLAGISEVMGIEASLEKRKIAHVHCCGTPEKAERRFKYHGTEDCLEATIIPGGSHKSCSFGCMGLGSCVRACAFDAIHIENGVAVVDGRKCTACGACVKACPKNLISLIPEDAPVFVDCLSCDRGKAVTEVCKAGCIGCSLCMRSCEHGAIQMEKNHPVFDYEKCVGCMACKNKCPVHVIHSFSEASE